MIDWTTVAQLMVCLVLLALVVGVAIRMTRSSESSWDEPIGHDDDDGYGFDDDDDNYERDEDYDDLDDLCEWETAEWPRVVTPDEMREHMLTARQRAARSLAQDVEAFKAHGDDAAVIYRRLGDTRDDAATIAELLSYQSAGWVVEFNPGAALMFLPKVVS